MNKSRKNTSKQEENSLRQDFIFVLKGAVFAVIITLICIVIFAFIMQLASLQESIIRPVIQVVRILSISVGGVYVARLSHTKGWLKGAVTGFFYVIFISILGIMSGGQFAFDRTLLSDMTMAVIVGAVSGAIGINIK